jgi:protein-S-isoprenylcysteine O-methyltransferase Ste14
MRFAKLIGAGDRIVAATLPVAAAGIAANIIWADAFRTALGRGGLIAGVVLLAIGVPLWLWAVVQILVCVPRGKLITSGPYAIVLHPIYTFVALLVIPGVSLVVGSWIGFVLGGALYVSSRLFARREERELAEIFAGEYASYRAHVLLPWL